MSNHIQGPLLDFLSENPNQWFTLNQLVNVVAKANGDVNYQRDSPNFRNSVASGISSLVRDTNEAQHHPNKDGLYRYVAREQEHDDLSEPHSVEAGHEPTVNKYVSTREVVTEQWATIQTTSGQLISGVVKATWESKS
jgi:hypothetical protein